MAHDLRRAGRDVLVVDAHDRVGDAWRTRWDSLRLFTPRDLDTLPGVPFPRGEDPFPNKDEVADYQECYALETRLPTRLGERAARLDPSVLQLHSRDYQRARDLPEGPVVVVGAANSGGDIAVEVARERPTTIAIGTRKPLAPKRYRSPTWWKLALLRDRIFHERTADVSWLPWPLRAGGYLEADLARAAADYGLRLAPRAVDAVGDAVRFADGSSAQARTVIWATGYRADHSWIDAPKENGLIAIGRHGSTPVGRLHFVRGRFLFAISRHARDVARDVGRIG
ncbi:MAG: hypothetical protein E6J35_05190 [Chloroflexi bacterium]|nr:MAG: hypothetical protein E6J35_05190 [Chloroflexota bacterium]